MTDGEPAGVDHRVDMSPLDEDVGAGDRAGAKFVGHRGRVVVSAWLLGLLGWIRLVWKGI